MCTRNRPNNYSIKLLHFCSLYITGTFIQVTTWILAISCIFTFPVEGIFLDILVSGMLHNRPVVMSGLFQIHADNHLKGFRCFGDYTDMHILCMYVPCQITTFIGACGQTADFLFCCADLNTIGLF